MKIPTSNQRICILISRTSEDFQKLRRGLSNIFCLKNGIVFFGKKVNLEMNCMEMYVAHTELLEMGDYWVCEKMPIEHARRRFKYRYLFTKINPVLCRIFQSNRSWWLRPMAGTFGMTARERFMVGEAVRGERKGYY